MLCARALVRALHDTKNRAQQGCTMQFSGITLNICNMCKEIDNNLEHFGLHHEVERDVHL